MSAHSQTAMLEDIVQSANADIIFSLYLDDPDHFYLMQGFSD
jgi:hypothetical protein